MPTYVGAGAWGAGKGAPLTAAEFDGNTYEWRQAIDALIANPPEANGVSSISVAGTAMTVTLTDGAELGPFGLPVLLFRWRDAWTAATLYDALDSFSVVGEGIFVVLFGHTSAGAFDPAAVGPAEAAGAFVVARTYKIATVGTTDFTLIGASSNTVGVEFRATGAGSGSGTATPVLYRQLLGAGSNTELDELADVTISAPADNDFIVYALATDSWTNRTPTQVTALLSTMTGDSGAGGTKGLVGAPAAGDANKVWRGDASWASVSALIDAAIGSTRGAILYRGAAGWAVLAPGTDGQLLETQGAGADPQWVTASSHTLPLVTGDTVFNMPLAMQDGSGQYIGVPL